MKKRITSKNKSSKKDYLTILLEDMRGDIKALAEGQVAFRNETNIKLADLKSGLDDFKQETRSNFKAVFEYLSRIEDEIYEIKESLKKLEKEKADWPIIKELLKRVEKIEKELAFQKNLLRAK